MSERHADPRRVLEVIGLAVEMLAEGASPRGLLAEAVRRMGLEPRLGRSDESTEGYALWTAALAAERAAAPIGPYQEAYHRTSDERSEALRKTARALRADILSVAIFCGAIAGALDSTIRALIAAAVRGEADALVALLDLAEQRGLHDGGYGPERYEEWPERDAHGTGDNPHVWLPVHAQPFDGSPSVPLPNADPQCTCGLRRSVVHGTTYRHDKDRPFARMHVGRDC